MGAMLTPIVPGVFLGQAGMMHVPAFVRIELYRSPDEQTEIDVLAENDEQ
ncbi:hypothetical protein [Candidatus Amarolinea dominans]